MTRPPPRRLTTMDTKCRSVPRDGGKVRHINRIRTLGRFVLLFTFFFILAGCGVQESFTVSGTPRPLTCEILAEFPWQEFSFGVDAPADVSSIAINFWGVEQDQFHFTNLYRDNLSMEWSGSHSRRKINYSALFGVERQLERVDVTWNPPATVAQVIDCLGAPRFYSAYYGPGHRESVLYLDLWYPDKGFSVHQSFLTRVTPFHPVVPALRIDGFRVTAPTLSEQAAPSLYAAGHDLLRTAYELCQIRSWPGSLEAIEAYDEDPRCE